MADEVYVARLWLTCDSADKGVEAAFNQRWTRNIQHEWETLVLESDGKDGYDDLSKFLTRKIEERFRDWITEDLKSRGVTYEGLSKVFDRDPDNWSGGPAGLRESKRPVVAVLDKRRTQWTVAGGGNARGLVFAHCAVRRVGVESVNGSPTLV